MEEIKLIASQFRDVFNDYKDYDLNKLKVTCSVGIALYPEHGNSYYELKAKADEAVYKAKYNDKNQYVIYEG